MGSYADFLKSLSDATYDDSEEGEMEEDEIPMDEGEDASAGAKEVSSYPLFFFSSFWRFLLLSAVVLLMRRFVTRLECEMWEEWGATYGRNGWVGEKK